MGRRGRFDAFIEKHIGFGIRWAFDGQYWLDLSVSILCFTFNFGIGKEKQP